MPNGNGNYFPIICIGGSAGGLDAYGKLLKNLPKDTGAAVVIVNHMRKIRTMLPEILPRYTEMPVELVTEKLFIKPNHVFVIPENRDLHVLNGEFRLEAVSKPYGFPDVITVFLRSMAQHWKGSCVAVILSGLDSDGTAALRGIKEIGGMVFAQKVVTAQQPDMPQNAINSRL